MTFGLDMVLAGFSGAGAARTSIRPMVTWIVGAVPVVSGVPEAAGAEVSIGDERIPPGVGSSLVGSGEVGATTAGSIVFRS